jgi:hypothetical protein
MQFLFSAVFLSVIFGFFVGHRWKSAESMTFARKRAAVSLSPFSTSTSQKLFVTGGYESVDELDTAEILTDKGWRIVSSPPVSGHCSVGVNATTVMVIGGRQNRTSSSATYFFNTDKNTWTEGPKLKQARQGHSCGRVRNQKEQYSLVVAGGFNGPLLSSVEILDEGAGQWREGPELPFAISDSQMVESKDGGVVLLGGWAPREKPTRLDTFFKLRHSGVGAKWELMSQRLKTGRSGHLAFLVPDNLVNCSKQNEASPGN